MYEKMIKEEDQILWCYTRVVSYWLWLSREEEPQFDLIEGFVIEFHEDLGVFVMEYTPMYRVMWSFKTEEDALDHLLAHVNEMKERMKKYVEDFQEKMKPYSLNEQYKDFKIEAKKKDYSQTPVGSYLNRLQQKVLI